MSQASASQTPASGPSPSPECVICVQPLCTSSPGIYGISPSCSHVFCGLCLFRWNRTHKTCPTCRSDCPGIVVWPHIELTPGQIMRIYQLQHPSLLSQAERNRLGIPAAGGRPTRVHYTISVQNPRVTSTDPLAHCAICVQPLCGSSPGMFGLSLTCSHAFCALCLVRFNRQSKYCPTCLIECPGIVVWPRNDITSGEMLKIFQLENAFLLSESELAIIERGFRQPLGRAHVQAVYFGRVVTNFIFHRRRLRQTVTFRFGQQPEEDDDDDEEDENEEEENEEEENEEDENAPTDNQNPDE